MQPWGAKFFQKHISEKYVWSLSGGCWTSPNIQSFLKWLVVLTTYWLDSFENLQLCVWFIDHRSLRIQNVHHPSTKVENTWEKLRFISLANILWLFVPWFIAPCSAGKIMSSITCSSMQAVLKINQSFPIHTHTQRSCMRSQATGPCDVMLKRKTTGFQLCWHLPRGKHTHRYLNKTVEIDREI